MNDTNGTLKGVTAEGLEGDLAPEQVTIELRAFLTHIRTIVYRERSSLFEASRLHWCLLAGIPYGGLLEKMAGDHFSRIEDLEESMEEPFCD